MAIISGVSEVYSVYGKDIILPVSMLGGGGDVIGIHSSTSEQYFRPTILPDSLSNEVIHGRYVSGGGRLRLTKEEVSIIERERERCISGCWFMNRGVPVYLTGHHYRYLNYWNLDIGLPSFRMNDAEYYYFWDDCERDLNCGGMINAENRRGGKTYKATNILYGGVIGGSNLKAGIQSKTFPDAKKAFRKLVDSWRRLPFFLKPDDDGSVRPKTSLDFSEPTRAGGANVFRSDDDYLDSGISCASSVSGAYDGEKLYRYLMDEAGKTLDADVTETWAVVSQSMRVGQNIVGKGIVTTTVEEMERGGGRNFAILWAGSDITKKNVNGRTATTLHRYFKPADYGFEGFVDRYGMTDRVAARSYILNERKGLPHAALLSHMRKNPLNEAEAFQSAQGECLFDEELINAQIERLELSGCKIVSGRFEREGERGVKFVEGSGFWDFIDGELSVDVIGTGLATGMNVKYAIGVDPIDMVTLGGSKNLSDMAGVVLKRHGGIGEDIGFAPVGVYKGRHKNPSLDFEQLLLSAIFFNTRMNIERNRGGAMEIWLRTDKSDWSGWSLMSYCLFVRGKSGMEMNSHDVVIPPISNYLFLYSKNLYFWRLLAELRDFGRKNTDIVMAFYFALAMHEFYLRAGYGLEADRVKEGSDVYGFGGGLQVGIGGNFYYKN